MTFSTWGYESERTIREARAEAKQMGLSPADTLKHVDDAYPFGVRKYHPYKMWLKVRRSLCSDLPGVRPLPVVCRNPRVIITKPKPENPNQCVLSLDSLAGEAK